MSDGTLNAEDWEGIDSIFDAFQMLRRKGRLSVDLWRKFHCMRCREIWEYIRDPRSRKAVEIAERVLKKNISNDEMQPAFENASHASSEAWEKVWALRIPGDPCAALWPVSQAVDDAWIQYCAASAAEVCAESADERILFTSIPDIDVRAWRDARPEILARLGVDEIDDDSLREMVLQRWEEIGHEEEHRLVAKLRDLVEAENRVF